MADACKAGVGEKQSPARGKVGVARLAAAETPEKINECNDHSGDQRNAQERMGESAVMIQAERGAAKAAEDVEVGSFSGQS